MKDFGANDAKAEKFSGIYGSHLSNDMATSAPILCWAPSPAMCTTYRQAMQHQLTGSQAKGMPRDNTHIEETPPFNDQWTRSAAADGHSLLEKDDFVDENLEEYVRELVPALRMVSESNHIMDIAHRKEAIKFTADALLVRRASGMAWSDALSERVSNYCKEACALAHGHQGTEISATDLAEIDPDVAKIDPDVAEIGVDAAEMAPDASSSCIRTPVSSEATNYSCEFYDHEIGVFHHGSAASLVLSDHSSMVGSTSELIAHDDPDALNCGESDVSLALMDIVSTSDAHMSSANSSGELSMCRKGEDQLHAEINARLDKIRNCCREWNDQGAGIAKKSSSSAMESLQVTSSIRELEHVHDTLATNMQDDHLMRTQGLHDDHGISGDGFHVLVPPCQHADVTYSTLTQHVPPAAVSQLQGSYVQNVFDDGAVGCRNADVACHVVHYVHGMTSERVDVASCGSSEVALGEAKQCEVALGDADVEGGDLTALKGMHMPRKAVTDDVDANERDSQVDGELEGWRQGLTWQGSVYVESRADVAGDVLFSAKVDGEVGEAIRGDSHGRNNNVREMMYRAAAYQPIDWESIMEEVVGKERPRRRNVRISKEPQSIVARQRRERISERIRILQRLVPGTSKLDISSILDEAIHYLKFLKIQVQALQRVDRLTNSLSLPITNSHFPLHLAPSYPFQNSPSTPTFHLHPFPSQV